MEEKKIRCTLITPVFSFGAYQYISELRASELKGAMRYTYRIACPSDTKMLARDEAELFGNASGSAAGHASPIRLLLQGNITPGKKDLLLHRTEKKQILSCFLAGNLEITACLNQAVLKKGTGPCRGVDLGWYEDLIKLSLILCGMGRRSRKGRGCFAVDDVIFENKQQMLEWICRILNKTAAASSQKFGTVYEINDQRIFSKAFCQDKRPVIQIIRIGRKMDKRQIDGYLWAVDQTCHELKKGEINLPKEITGAAKGGKFASPLLIRIVKTKEGYYPIYVFIKGIYHGKMIDLNCQQREQFICELEKIQGKEVRR